MHPLIIGTMLALAQDSGAFVVRLGNDTLSLEQYRRTATHVHGELVIRAPSSVHRLYTLELNKDGSVRRLDLVTHNISGGPGLMETKASIELNGTEAYVKPPGSDTTLVTRLPVTSGAFPYALHVYGLVEQLGLQVRGNLRDSLPLTAVTMGGGAPATGVVRKLGGDTVLFTFTGGSLAGLGPFRFRLDPKGHLTSLTGRGSTVQVEVERVPWGSFDLSVVGKAYAQRSLGQLSPRDTARAAITGAEVWVDYGRPTKRGREIFGNLVPWNTVWRTGANAATQLSTSVDLTIGGAAVPAGKYTLWTLPTPTGWQLIVNKQTGQWGTVYDPAQDLVRVDAKVETLATPVEQFTIAFESGKLTLTWDKTRVSVPLSKK